MRRIVPQAIACGEELRKLQACSGSRTERQRAMIVRALSRGLKQHQVALAVGCSVRTVKRAVLRFDEAGIQGLTDGRKGRLRIPDRNQIEKQIPEIVAKQPQDFGFARATWTKELVSKVVHEKTGALISPGHIGRLLHRAGCRRVRPKPTIALGTEDKAERLKELSEQLSCVSRLDVVLYEDEVDIHLNPKVGPDWTPPGMRKKLVTPGQNRKGYIAGAFNPKTRKLVTVSGPKKDSKLFIRLLDELTQRYRGFPTIHLVVDNYIIHRSKLTQFALNWHKGKVVLHPLPPYSPEANPIERVWLDLHNSVTRNHRCADLPALMEEVECYLAAFSGHGGKQAALRRSSPLEKGPPS